MALYQPEMTQTLSLLEYIAYIGGDFRSSYINEGEEVLKAGHIILYGKTQWNYSSMRVCALCLHSDLHFNPYEISGELNFCNDSAKIVEMQCSCEAGGLCKHISAFLILLTRQNLSELEKISKFELACALLNRKKSVHGKYRAIPVCDMSRVEANVDFEKISACSELDTSILNYFITNLPNSAIAKYS